MRQTRKASIRRFIALWVGAVWISIGLLVLGLMSVIPRLNAKTQRIFADGQTLQTNQLFELAIVTGSRDELRDNHAATSPIVLRSWHNARKAAPLLWVREADHDLRAMQQQADTPSETDQVAEIAHAYAPVRQLALSSPVDSRSLQQSVDLLLSRVHRHRGFEMRESALTLRSSHALDLTIERVAIGLTLLSSSLLFFGCALLWRRIFQPMLALSQAASAFGEDLQVRAPVLRHDEMGEVCHTFNVMADVICEREHERLRFVATVAHDLKNPLTFIGSAIYLLRDKDYKLTPDEKTEWLNRILSGTRRLESIIGDLMDGVQAQTGHLAFEMKPFDYAELVRETTDEFATSVQTHPISFHSDGPCWVNGDAKRLERVLANLLSNAVKYSKFRCPIEVGLECRGEQGVLIVRDQGTGIAPEDFPKLFLPFSRLERTQKMANGTGLGLASVKKIVEGHNGTIHVESVLGQGTTVVVTLPLLHTATGKEQ